MYKTTTGQEITAPPHDWDGAALTPIGVDTAFNGYVAAHVIFALHRLALLDSLESGDVDVREFAASTGTDLRMLQELLRAAACCGYVTLLEESAALTPAGREAARLRGYFTWVVGGYAEVFARMADIATGTCRFNDDVHRNEAMVALGSAQNDQAVLGGILGQVLDDVDFTMIADLGSGNSARICRVIAGRDGSRGVGLDISSSANQLAQETIRQSGLSDRARAVQRDVRELAAGRRRDSELSEVDAVMSFFLLHDLLADPATRQAVLPGLRESFPNARTFVLADTMLRPARTAGTTVPVFSLGYELAHAMMGVPLHTRESYEALFEQAGMRIRWRLPFGTPHSWLYVLETD
ncbi:MAG TPA: class I SAM-dependent methyltransferase [Streptosporangiaceae bacterium]|nr:class I SAM-dependent methyltransferase [Streptosporangiaceae bacterium]